MTETRDMLQDSAERLFAEHCDKPVVAAAEHGEFPEPLWRAIAAGGFAVALVPEAAGGSGITMSDAQAVVRAASAHAAPVPLVESMLANWLLATSGLAAADGPHSIAPVTARDRAMVERDAGGWRVRGHASRVPWSRRADAIAMLAMDPQGAVMVVRLRPDDVVRVAGKNLAGEPRDDLSFDVVVADATVAPAPHGFGPDQLQAFGAAMRAIQIAGALARVLDMTVRYAQERVQFGRPIGKFQAIQQNLAVLAGQVAAAGAAADLAAEAVDSGFDTMVIAAAKARAGEAASAGAAIAHQVHGAIGFTMEHPLNHCTRRLWSWRDEFGSEAHWNRRVGELAAKAGPDRLWATITAAA